MMNSSLACRAAAIAVAAVSIAGLAVLAGAAGASQVLVGIGGLAASAAIAVLGAGGRREASRKESIRRALELCRKIQAGDFEARITDIRDTDEIGELLWAIND